MQTGDEHIDFDLLAKYLAGETTAAENAEVETWVHADEANKTVLDELRGVFDLTDGIDAKVEVDTDAAWAKTQQRIQVPQEAKVVQIGQKEQSGLNTWRWAAVAAMFLGALLITRILLMNSPGDEGALTEISTMVEVREETLPDGSVITLNANSSISYTSDFGDKERRIALNGEAFFDVARDEERPFVIDAGEAQVTVLGTSFNVSAYDQQQEIVVIVETGKVQLSDKKEQKVTLTATDKGTLNKKDKTLLKTTNDDELYLFWHLQKLVFTNTELSEVVKVLNNEYEARLSLEDEAAYACKFTATFQDESLQTILSVLTATFDLELEEGPQGRILKGKACDTGDI